jgi:hypothetical protein
MWQCSPLKYPPLITTDSTFLPRNKPVIQNNNLQLQQFTAYNNFNMLNMETIVLNARNYPAHAYTVFFDRAEAKRDFPGIKLAVSSSFPHSNPIERPQ